MHPVNQVVYVFLKKEGPSVIRTAIRVLVCFPLLLAVWALAIQYVLDRSHLGSSGANANALFGMPYLEHVRLCLQGSIDGFPRNLVGLVLRPPNLPVFVFVELFITEQNNLEN
jgi:hypothetical protein